jgi:hypothetical protein
MHTGSTSVLDCGSCTRFGASSTFVRVGLAIAIACTPVTGALAQGRQSQSRSNNQQSQAEGQRQPTSGRLIVPITGTVGTAAMNTPARPTAQEGDAAPTVQGSFSIQRFARTTDGGVAAVGTLTLSSSDATTDAARTIIAPGTMPLASGGNTVSPGDERQGAPSAIAQGCETLSVVLGEVDLELPGRVIQLDEVNVEFVQGVGERHATLLCEIAGLIGGAGRPTELVDMLNTLLDTLG